MRTILVIWAILLAAQSLEEVSRKEAKRRKELEQQGIEGKLIDPEAAERAQGNLTTSSPVPVAKQQARDPGRTSAARSAKSYSTALKKLDREIRDCEARLSLLRHKIDSERWALPKTGKVSRSSSSSSNSSQRMQDQVQALDIKLRGLREERREKYQSGIKAGFLPGELEDRGVIP